MSVLDRVVSELECEQFGLASMPLGRLRLYAIAFDLDQEWLRTEYPGQNTNNAYGDIRRRLEDEGFQWMQGSLYYGRPGTDPVTCVLVIQRLARELPWFGNSVRDIRMLRIEENNDLRPAIPQPELKLR